MDDKVLFVYSHPLRLRILASLNEEGDGAPSDLGRRLGTTTEDVSYHIKILLQHGFVEEIETQHVRNAKKTIYRAIRRLEFPPEVWDELPPAVQNQTMFGTFMSSFGDAKAALMAGAFEEHPESHVSWTTFQLDLPTWLKLVEVFDRAYFEAKKIGEDFKERKQTLADEGVELLTISTTLTAFPMPKNGKGNKPKA